MTPAASSPLTATSVLSGRVRWRVACLRGNSARAQALTDLLSATVGVRRVCANPYTGRLLAVYEPAQTGVNALARLVTRSLLEPESAAGHRLDQGAPSSELVHGAHHDHDHAQDRGLGGYVARLMIG